MQQQSRFVCFGELLLRLSAPGRQPLLQSPTLEVHVGGAEANVAVSLARLGHETSLVSRVPDNALGEAAVGELRRQGVGTTAVGRADGRMGLYFLTMGAMQRASQIIYDRAGSAFARACADQFDWPHLLQAAQWLHLSGITPALGPESAESAVQAARQARQQGTRVSFDGNYRPQLWQRWQGDAPHVLRELFALADILFVDHRDLEVVLGQQVPLHADAFTQAQANAALAFSTFPHLKWIACTHRHAKASDQHLLSASLCSRDLAVFAPAHELAGVVDRIGGGDAFAAGILHGLSKQWPLQDVVRFGLAAGCLKHSWPGDFSYSTENEIHELVRGASVDVKR